MKKFMLIFIAQDYQQLGLSPEQMQERMGKWMGWNAQMQEAGVVETGHALTPGGKTIRGENRTVTDGPFAEGKEVVGGYYVVKAKDLDGAMEIAQGYPDYDLGGNVEVREIMVFDQ